MFKFGFSPDSDHEEEIIATGTEADFNWMESEKVVPENSSFINNFKVETAKCAGFSIKYVSTDKLIDVLGNGEHDDSIITAHKNHSDLLTAVYEGGLKVWECTFDLLHFICEQSLDLLNKKVLDLGCGAGLVGIAACLKGSRTVFQDYNIDVIKSVTSLNVVLNGITLEDCDFYSGDWTSFLTLIRSTCENDKFDYIFTSETIYNNTNYKKLLNVFTQLLKDDGVIYLAAKTHYFGVGGGMQQFKNAMNEEGCFDYSTCWLCSDGVKREIIRIVLK